MTSMVDQIRYATRSLLKNRGFALAAILTIALGIGAITVVFSVVNTVLVRPLPFHDPERLVLVTARKNDGNRQLSVISPSDYIYWQQQNKSFASIAGISFSSWNINDEQNPERVQVARVSPGFFEMLNIRPILGRTFRPEEVQKGLNRVVMLGETMWAKKFGRNPNVIGKPLLINGTTHTIIGVAPDDLQFHHPRNVEGWPVSQPKPDFWNVMPEWSIQDRWSRFMLAVARLKEGITIQQAQNEMQTIARSVEELHLDSHRGWGAHVVALQDQIASQVRFPLQVLFGLTTFVLLIAVCNVANLLLARVLSRQKELAIRSALGAQRLHILRQFATESMVLTVLGGTLGVFLANWGIQIIAIYRPANIPRIEEIGVDLYVLSFSVIASAISALIFSLAPALTSMPLNLQTVLKQSGVGSSKCFPRERLRPLLVSGEISMAFVLLIGAAILAASFFRLTRTNPGFNPEDVVAFDVSLVDRKYKDINLAIHFVKQLEERMQAVPGFESTAVVYGLPFSSIYSPPFVMTIEGQSSKEPGHGYSVDGRYASPLYFKTLEIPLITGRYFNTSDSTNSKAVVIVNQTFVQKFFPNQNVVGKQLNLEDGSVNPCEIVGVVSDISPLDIKVNAEVYRPIFQMCPWDFSVIVRTRAGSADVSEIVRREIAALDPNRPFYNIRTITASMASHLAPRKFMMILTSIFAGIALVLAMIGVYGVISYSVRQREREIGIRRALGARNGHIIGVIIKEGALLSGIGIAAGILIALYLDRLLRPITFNIGFSLVGLYLLVVVLLLAVACFACCIPARRALRTDPLDILRNE